MSIRFVLVILAYLSPIFVVRWLWPRVARPHQAVHFLFFASAALVGAFTSVLGSISFVLTLLGGVTAECTQAWQCALAMEFDGSRGLFLFGALFGGGLSYLLVLLCRRIATHRWSSDR